MFKPYTLQKYFKKILICIGKMYLCTCYVKYFNVHYIYHEKMVLQLKHLFGPTYILFSIKKYNLNNEKLHIVFCTLKKSACE